MLTNAALVLSLPLLAVAVRLAMNARRGRVVVLDRPKPCSMDEAQHALDRLVGAGIRAEIVEAGDHALNMWAGTPAATSITPQERYVIQVPRRQAEAASRI